MLKVVSSFKNVVINLIKRKMSDVRYIPNSLPDYILGNEVIIPIDIIRKQINTYVSEIVNNFKPNLRNGRDGLYLGTSGVAYMFYHLSKFPQLSDNNSDYLSKAVEYMKPALEVCSNEKNVKDIPSFMLGNCGVYAVAASILDKIDKSGTKYKELYDQAGKTCKELNFLNIGSDELFVGRSGYICGMVYMANETKVPYNLDVITNLCKTVIKSGRQYAHTHKSAAPLMYAYYGTEYLGGAHGVSSIILPLLSVPEYLEQNPSDLQDIQSTIDYILSLQSPDGNFPACIDEAQFPRELVHWCHGAPGIIYLIAKAYNIWGEQKYLDVCVKCADLIWKKGLLKKGPGICHGVAGNGYAFLIMYRLTNDVMYLHRALQFATFIETEDFKNLARIPDNPYSLFEGLAGTVCYLVDLLNPKQAHFPFSDIFN